MESEGSAVSTSQGDESAQRVVSERGDLSVRVNDLGELSFLIVAKTKDSKTWLDKLFQKLPLVEIVHSHPPQRVDFLHNRLVGMIAVNG